MVQCQYLIRQIMLTLPLNVHFFSSSLSLTTEAMVNMKKWILLLLSLLLFPFIVFFGCFALMSGDHHYRRDDIISYWLYTPDILKRYHNYQKKLNMNIIMTG